MPVSHVHERFEEEGLEPNYFWTANDEFPDHISFYDGVLLTGSPHGAYEDIPWIQREHELIRELAGLGTPMLGICFGSQILASALGGRDQVFRRETCEVAFTHLDLTEAAANDPLMRGQERSVFMYVWHNDEVRHDHPDMRILATTPDCPNHIWRYRDQPVWGIQGHPELSRAHALALFEENHQRLEKDGANIEELKRKATDAPEAKQLLSNFATIVKKRTLAHGEINLSKIRRRNT